MLLALATAFAAELPHRIHLDVGFAHWFGPTSGSPDGFTTPALTLGVQPGLAFLDLDLRYTRSIPPVGDAQGTAVGLGFASFAILARHELRVGAQSVVVYAGPLGLLHHDDVGATSFGAGLSLGARYTFAVTPVLRLGPALGVHEVFYTLPGEDRSLVEDPRREAQIDLGVTASLF